MKKTPFLINVFLLIIVFACKEKTAVRNLEPESENKNKVIFKIDERTEFFRTIFNIATQDVLSEDIRPCNTQYLKRVNKHFLPYKNQSLTNFSKTIKSTTVKLFRKLRSRFWMKNSSIKLCPFIKITRKDWN
ncbi:hypothetical protein [Aquimarina macrocephali]|uniref:hypothetical protein n=1 Tax=Aquimarina macrocephali TaxID=666563 RepID=UPI000466C741|nr:hypothetical protein [Aquimarina macrocephali]